MDKEKIVCAAMQVTFEVGYGKKYTGEFNSAYYDDSSMQSQINDFKNGLLDVFAEAVLLEEKTVKGFITNKLDAGGFPKFVDAKEAMEIAIKARQITSPVDLVMAMKNRIKMAKLDPEEYGGESYIKHLESEIKAIDIAKTELKPEDLY